MSKIEEIGKRLDEFDKTGRDPGSKPWDGSLEFELQKAAAVIKHKEEKITELRTANKVLLDVIKSFTSSLENIY